ncbi:MAG: glycosyltransferase family 1 protein [Geitlerinemataceae cyanobacterium]
MGKIAIDASGFRNDAFDGLNRYTREVLKGTIDTTGEFLVYTAETEIEQSQYDRISRIKNKTIARNDFRGNLSRLWWHQTALPRSLQRENVSLFYSPVPEGMLFPVCPQIITIHDLLPTFFPETYPRIKYYFQYILPQLIKSSTAIITVSEHTKKDIQRFFDCRERPIHVVYQPYRSDIFKPIAIDDRDRVKKIYNLDRFVLSVGETRPYKNIRRLIEAFSKIKVPDLTLAIVGKINKMDETIAQFPQQLGIDDRVRFLGFVPDSELAALYSSAQAFVFPSLYEGFGIPPLEAMACGCPTLVSQVASLPEVCGCAAYYIDPLDVNSIAEGISQVVYDDRLENYLKVKGLEQAKKFQNNDLGDRILKILQTSIKVDYRVS